MRIGDITDKFRAMQNCRGAYMVSLYDSETETQSLKHRLDGKPIADIYDYVDERNFRLRVHPYSGYHGRTSHINRVHSVLRSVQMPKSDSGRVWEKFRYSTYIRYALRVFDRNLRIEYELIRPLEFIYRDGGLVLDYMDYEGMAFPDRTPEPAPTIESNTNLQSVETQLNAIMAGV